MNKHLAALSLLSITCMAQAHSGHGIPGASHWHADDTLLYVALAAVATAGLWLARRK
jgi:hypothetical protein